uniref:putative nuclear RNA export factor SDE5 n=1 Tax=Erigeron canadensis TaxID=72917 RepID=UPI001CB8D069|nr:putative nuclear RNA export factor SDE5 [Erigeron canadensis]
MTKMDGASTNLTFSSDDEKNLEFLLEAFGSKLSADDMASAYCQAGHDLTKASEILYSMLGGSSTSAPVSSVGANGDGDAKFGNYVNKPSKGLSRSKPRNSGVSAGSISGIIGADYGKVRGASKKACTTSKPVKLMSNEIPASQIWDEKPQPVHATKESMNEDVELFLLTMLGDGFQLDQEVIREVLGGCGYDVLESMEKLMNLAPPTLDMEDVSPSLARAMSVETYEDLGSEFEHKLKFSDSSGSKRSNIEKELLNNLFTVPERSHGWPSTTSIREQRTRRYIVTGPLEDGVIQFRTPIVKKEVNGPGNEEIEDDYETLREAAREYWVTMKKYYRAAADAYVKGNYVVADKLVKEGHFYMAKARKANETSGKMLTQARDDGEAMSINLSDYDPSPSDAVRLLKTHLKSMSGIPSIRYLKVMVGTNNDKNKLIARKRRITRLLENDSITWTEEQDGEVMAIRIDVVNPKHLSFNK